MNQVYFITLIFTTLRAENKLLQQGLYLDCNKMLY